VADYVELKPGMRVLVPPPGGALGIYYNSAVRRLDKRGLLIDIPRLDGDDLPIEPGQTLQMYIQLHGRLYEFESRVRHVDLQVLLDEPSQAKRTERRGFYRLMVSIPARAIFSPPSPPVDADPSAPTPEPETMDVVLQDVSGGGARVRVDRPLEPGTTFDIEFPIGSSTLRLHAEVIRPEAIELGRGGYRYEAHCMFTEIRRGDQDRLVKFVFQKQRELSQRGVA
jgi:c-di-GMP-binding flagellar brake protein YcgR